jgi:hypothetical protein
MAKKITATSVIIVVFLTMIALGHVTRRISARVSRRNWPIRAKNPGAASVFGRRRPPSPDDPERVPVVVLGGGVPEGPSGVRSPAVSVSGSIESSLTLIFPNCLATSNSLNQLAGVPGFEPGLSVLETDVLTVDTIPLLALPASLWQTTTAITSSLYELCACGNGGRTC